MRRWRKLLLLIPAAAILIYLMYAAPKGQEEKDVPHRTLWYADTAIERIKREGSEYWGFGAATGRCVLVVEDVKVNPANPKGPRQQDDLYLELPQPAGPETVDLATGPVVVSFLSNRDGGLTLKPGTAKGTVKVLSVSEHALVADYTVRLVVLSLRDPGHEEGLSLTARGTTFTRQERPAREKIAGVTIQSNKKE